MPAWPGPSVALHPGNVAGTRGGTQRSGAGWGPGKTGAGQAGSLSPAPGCLGPHAPAVQGPEGRKRVARPGSEQLREGGPGACGPAAGRPGHGKSQPRGRPGTARSCPLTRVPVSSAPSQVPSTSGFRLSPASESRALKGDPCPLCFHAPGVGRVPSEVPAPYAAPSWPSHPGLVLPSALRAQRLWLASGAWPSPLLCRASHSRVPACPR